jgi:hypothetical protein
VPSKAQPVTKDTSNTIPGWLSDASQAGVASAAGIPQYTPYSGQGTAPMTPAQFQALSAAMGNAGSAQSVSMGAVPGFNSAMGFNAPQMTGASVGSNIAGLLSPYTQSNVDAANAQIDKNTAGATNVTDNGLAAQHAFGGDRQAIADADVQNAGMLSKNATDAGIYTNDYGNALNASTQMGATNANAALGAAGVRLGGSNAMAGLGTTIGGLNMNDLQGLLSTGGTQQATNQAADTFNVGQYQQQYQSQFQQMQALAQMLGTVPHDSNSNTTTTSYTNPWMQLAGLGLSAAAIPATGGGSALLGGLGGLFSAGGGGNGNQFDNTSSPYSFGAGGYSGAGPFQP